MSFPLAVPIWKVFFIFGHFLISDDYTLHGPVFIQEPSHVMFPLDSEEKRVKLNCEVKGNPRPHIRFVDFQACAPRCIVSMTEANKTHGEPIT